MLERIRRALTENEAATDPASPDPELRGRTYAIPFERIWLETLEMADGDLEGWRLVEADDRMGVVKAEARTRVFGWVDDLVIRIRLDPNAQTRVDMESRSRTGRGDLGANRRRIKMYFRELERRLDVQPEQIWDGPPSEAAPV